MGNFINFEWEIFSVVCEIIYWSRNNLKDFDGINLCKGGFFCNVRVKI